MNQQYDEAVLECELILKSNSNDVVSNRTRFILSRALMELENYNDALLVLENTELDAEFFAQGIQGLIGDCKSEQGKYDEALNHYLEAINANINESLTPYYLFKAYLCSKQLKRPIEANRYIQTVVDYFPSYAGKHQIEKYLTIDTLQPIQLDQREISQPAILGIGTVNGKPVSQSSYYEALRIARTNAQQQAQQTGMSIQEVEEDRVWKSFSTEIALQQEYERLELYVDEQEMMAYLMATDGYSVQAEFLNSPVFTNERGDFDSKKLLARINEMKGAIEPQQQEAWKNTADYYKKKLQQEKYFNLVGVIPFVTSLELESKIADDKTYKVKYYCERFRDMPDEDISISDEELRSYYEENKSKIEYRIQRDQRHSVFLKEEIVPTAADTVLALSSANALKEQFKKTKDDSSFVIEHSGLKFYTSGPYSTAVPRDHKKASEGKYITYPNSVAKQMLSTEIGGIVGPYLFGDDLTIAKVIGRTDEVINARHILLMTHPDAEGYTEEDAREIFKKVSNENFESYVKKYSEDTGSPKKGGYLGDFFFGDMVPTFATYCADAPIGEIGFVQTRFGYHIVQVTKRSGNRFPRLALVTVPVELSSDSYSTPRARLEEFRSAYLSYPAGSDVIEVVDSINQNLGTFARISEVFDDAPKTFAFDIQSSEDAYFQFAYDEDNSVGAISPIFGDSTSLYICILAGIHKKGIPSFDYTKVRMHSDLFLNRKSEMLRKHLSSYTQAKIDAGIRNDEISLSNPTIIYCGYEPSVVGKAINAFHTDKKAIITQGHSGIFYIEVIEELGSTRAIDKEQMRDAIYTSNKEFILSSARRSLVDINEIVDNRAFNRLKIRL